MTARKKNRLDAADHPLVEAQMLHVRQLAQGLARKLPARVDRADLVQDGLLGIMESLLRWTKEYNGTHFRNYASLRAEGAMLDGLRALDHGSRHVRKQMRQIEQAIQKLEHQLGRPPRSREVAQALDIALEEYQRLLQDADGYVLISLEDLGGDDAQSYFLRCVAEQADPLVVLERSALRTALAEGMKNLSAPMRKVLQLYYIGGLKMHEIGKQMQLSEARISQLHTLSIARLRAAMPEGQIARLLQPRSTQRDKQEPASDKDPA